MHKKKKLNLFSSASQQLSIKPWKSIHSFFHSQIRTHTLPMLSKQGKIIQNVKFCYLYIFYFFNLCIFFHILTHRRFQLHFKCSKTLGKKSLFINTETKLIHNNYINKEIHKKAKTHLSWRYRSRNRRHFQKSSTTSRNNTSPTPIKSNQNPNQNQIQLFTNNIQNSTYHQYVYITLCVCV